MSDHHYFATFALGYAKGATREEAVSKLVKGFRSNFKEISSNLQKEGQLGAYIWSAKVHVPLEGEYGINFYQPVGVEVSETREHFVTYVAGKKFAYLTAANGDSKEVGTVVNH
jgi:hypothetical protein